ncbi:MAG: hypothetical protein L0228_04295 [Planctomycetes bacterium]|nr:hypothetical protein [Planctomycetota bacterium]
MNQTTSESGLKAALTAFETCLATPIVSGELSDWLDRLGQSWAEASAQVGFEIEHRHPRQYEQIGKVDPELLPRVEQLQGEDEAIEADRNKLGQTVARTVEHAPKLEPDEEKAQQHTKKLVDDGTAFVARVRKQEVAVETWFVEAFNRDRGAGD